MLNTRLVAPRAAVSRHCCCSWPVPRRLVPTPSLPVSRQLPEALLAEGDAALGRNELPQAARAYRRAAEASDDEAVAEQAVGVAFDHSQYREALLAASRWLALNPSSEDARRYAGVAALELHRLDEAEAQFASLLETAFLSPAAGFLALLPVRPDHGTAPDVDGAVPPSRRAASGRRRGALRACRCGPALGELRGRGRAREPRDADRAVLDAGEAAVGPGARGLRAGGGRASPRRATSRWRPIARSRRTSSTR